MKIVNYFKNLGRGRIGRKYYLIGSILLLTIPISFIIYATIAVNLNPSTTIEVSLSIMALFTLYLIFMCLNLFSLKIRRLHDLGYSGFIVLLFVIPIIYVIFEIILIFKKGNVATNRYGEVPQNIGFLRSFSNIEELNQNKSIEKKRSLKEIIFSKKFVYFFLFILVTSILIYLFYWFEWRPSQIRKECSRYSNSGYDRCIRKNGLER